MNYYSAVKYIADQLLAAGFKTITFGDIDEVDIERENIYPLAHIVPESCAIATQPFTYTFTIIAIDTVFFPKGDIQNEIEPFFGMDNTQDVLADIHFRLAKFGEYLKRGEGEFEMEGEELSIDPFKERWESLVCGWVCGVTIRGANYASIC